MRVGGTVEKIRRARRRAQTREAPPIIPKIKIVGSKMFRAHAGGQQTVFGRARARLFGFLTRRVDPMRGVQDVPVLVVQ
ncbi:MAG: hypothetical protein DCC52_03855 [Chloroflexi bacterium]|nr:MAG: hypothetical protein DCC52_03855 [Chloroflexota bacterium]